MTDERLSKTFGYFAAFVALGTATAILGPTLPGLAENTQTQLSEIGFLFTAYSLGYLVGSFQSGWLYDRVPGHPVLAAGLVIVAGMLVLTPLIPLLWLLTIVLLIVGVAGSTLDVGGNTLLVWVHGRQVSPYMNGLHFFFGIGAFLAPIVVAQAVLVSGDIAWAYWVSALLMLPVAAWLLRLPSPSVPGPSTGEQNASGAQALAKAESRTHERLLVILISLLLFLYVGAEASFGGWIFTYALAKDLGSEATSAYLTSAFWGALTLGRLLSIPIAARFRPSAILFAALVGCLVSVGVIFLWPSSVMVLWLGTFALGLSMASIFPTAISLAERRLTITGRITSWFFVGASVGGMLLPWLIGQLFEIRGPWAMMVAIMIDLVLAMGVFVTLILYSSRRLSFPSELVYNGDVD